MALRFIDFSDLTPAQLKAAGLILHDSFAHMTSAFDERYDEEVASFLTDPDRAAFAAVDDRDAVLGWVGRIATYSHAWELHPMGVDPGSQRGGVGSALLAELEKRARAAGVLTLYLGSDDDFGGTNLFGRDLFPNVAGKIAGVAETQGHPMSFYAKWGYEIVGLIPDANGRGKPDILMAKRL